MEPRKRYSVARFAPVLGALICVLMFNSFLIIRDSNQSYSASYGASAVLSPLYFIENGFVKQAEQSPTKTPAINLMQQNFVVQKKAETEPAITIEVQDFAQPLVVAAKPVVKEPSTDFHHVSFDETEAGLSTEENQKIKETVVATKKVLTDLKWKEMETSMADVLSNHEKAVVKAEYMNELEKINWSNIEKNLKANYQDIDWTRLNTTLSTALTSIQLDSIQNSNQQLLSQLEAAESEICSRKKCTTSPLPDQSLTDLKKMKLEVKKNLESLKVMRSKPVIKL